MTHDELTQEITRLQASLAEKDASLKSIELAFDAQEERNRYACACMFDRPNDVCERHSPAVVKLDAELVSLRAALAEMQQERDRAVAERDVLREFNGLAHQVLTEANVPNTIDMPPSSDSTYLWRRLEWLVARLASLTPRTDASLPDQGLKGEFRTTSEICLCAAILTDDGLLVRGHRHHHCFHVLRERGWPGGTTRQGFITSQGRFVNRTEGRQLQDAAGIASVAPGGYRGTILFSEDLYV